MPSTSKRYVAISWMFGDLYLSEACSTYEEADQECTIDRLGIIQFDLTRREDNETTISNVVLLKEE